MIGIASGSFYTLIFADPCLNKYILLKIMQVAQAIIQTRGPILGIKVQTLETDTNSELG